MIINATKGKDLNIQNGTGEGSIVEGSPVDGTYSLPEATGINSHGEGIWSDATGDYSHAEGSGATASGWAAHAEGYNTTSSGRASHAEGYFTIANHAYQHVFGSFNIGDPSTAANTEKGNYIEIVGNGNSTSQVNRSNARTLDWEGNEVLSGYLATKSTVIDASKANNNVSAELYPSTFDIRDSANRIISRQEAVVQSSGDILGHWYVRNYNTSGEQVAQKGILMRLNKSGIMTYEVSNPANFCSAIGAIGASGGTITGQITKAGVSKSWVYGRDGAIVRMTSINGYSPCISLKTTNGTWEMGAYDYSTHTDRLIFTYITDSNYNSNNNAVTGQVQFLGGGHVVANNYYGSGSQLTGLNGSNISSGTVAAARLPQVQRVQAWKSSNFAATYTGSLSWNGPNITIPIFALITVRLDANDANIGYTQVLLPYCGTSSGYYWFGYNGNSGYQYTGGVDASGTHGGKLYHRNYQRMAINQTANNYCDLTFESSGYVGSTSNARYCTPVLIELFGF